MVRRQSFARRPGTEPGITYRLLHQAAVSTSSRVKSIQNSNGIHRFAFATLTAHPCQSTVLDAAPAAFCAPARPVVTSSAVSTVANAKRPGNSLQ